MSLLDLMKAKAVATADKKKSETVDITILDVNVATAAKGLNGEVYPRVRVSTKEMGELWIFADNLIGALTSYGAGVKAKAILIPNTYKDKQGNEVNDVAVRSIKVEAISTETQAMIQSLPQGAALFAAPMSAKVA